jgi:hypothetical protein
MGATRRLITVSPTVCLHLLLLRLTDVYTLSLTVLLIQTRSPVPLYGGGTRPVPWDYTALAPPATVRGDVARACRLSGSCLYCSVCVAS